MEEQNQEEKQDVNPEVVNQTIEKENKKKDVHRKTKLRKLGATLPVFRGTDEQREAGKSLLVLRSKDNLTQEQKEKVKELEAILPDRTFSFKEWDFDLEEKIGEMRAKANNVGKSVSAMLNMLIDEFEGRSWDDIREEEKLVLLNQLEFGNMLYLYYYLRYEVMGEELIINVPCPFCKEIIQDYVADLGTLDVFVKDSEHPYVHTHELKKPIMLKGVEYPITGVVYSYARWAAMESVKNKVNPNDALLKKEVLKSSVIGFDSENAEGTFIDKVSVLRKMNKGDIEKLTALITDNNAGPHMLIGGTCPHCDGEFAKGIEWGYEDFFGSSSL